MTINNATDLTYPILLYNNNNQLIRIADCVSFVAKYYTTDINKAAICTKAGNALINIIEDINNDIALIDNKDIIEIEKGVLLYQYEYIINDIDIVINGNTNYYINYNKGANPDIDLTDYYTKLETYNKQEVNALIDNVDVDLTDYYNKQEVNTLINNVDVDLSNYYNKQETYKKQEVNTLINNVDVDLSNYYNKQEVNTLINNVDVDLSDYYTKSQTYNKQEVNTLIDGVTAGDIDLTNYYKKDETDLLMNNKVDKVTDKQLSTNDYTTIEKTKLQSLNNYDDKNIRDLINNKVEKVENKGLILNSEAIRLKGIHNYDDTAINEKINSIPETYSKNELYIKTEIDAKIEDARIDINMTDEQLSKLNVNLTPIENEIDEINLFPIKNKSLLVLGDSLSSAGGGTMDNPVCGSWAKTVKEKLKLSNESRVIANGGATLSDKYDTTLKMEKVEWTGSNNVLSNQVYSVLNYKKQHSDYEPDMIIIMVGTNNVSTNYPDNQLINNFGDWEQIMYNTTLKDNDYDMIDTGTTTGLTHYNSLRTFRSKLYAAYKWTIETLITNFPNANLYICQPLHNAEGRGKNMFEFYPHIEKIAAYYSIPLINTNAATYLSYFSNTRKNNGWDNNFYTFDGTHPDWVGQPLIGNYVAKYLKNNYFEKPKITAKRTGSIIDDTYYTVTSQSTNDEFGTVMPSGATSVRSGNNLTINISPKTNYRVYELLVDGNAVEKSNQYTFNNITSNHTLIADFELIPVTNNPPTLNSISINNNASSTNNPILNIMINGEGNITHYRLGLSNDLSNIDYITYNSNSINYTLLNTGNTTIFIQLKNEYGESAIKSATINYSESTTKQKAILSFCDAPYPGAFESGFWKTTNQKGFLDFISTDNEKMGKLISNKDNMYSPYNANLIGYITGNNSGIYPDWVLEKNCSATNPKIGEIELQVKNGTYKVSLLFNVSSSCAWGAYISEAADSYAEVNGVKKIPSKIKDNSDTLLVFNDVDCVDGTINVKFSSNVANKRVCLTTMEIEEL